MATNTLTPNQPVLDYELALSRVGGDADLLKELGGLFLDEYPRLLAEIHDAQEKGAAEQLEHAAHSLKGSAANFGAKEAVALSAEIEQLGAKGDVESAGQMLPALDLALLALSAELTRL